MVLLVVHTRLSQFYIQKLYMSRDKYICTQTYPSFQNKNGKIHGLEKIIRPKLIMCEFADSQSIDVYTSIHLVG